MPSGRVVLSNGDVVAYQGRHHPGVLWCPDCKQMSGGVNEIIIYPAGSAEGLEGDLTTCDVCLAWITPPEGWVRPSDGVTRS